LQQASGCAEQKEQIMRILKGVCWTIIVAFIALPAFAAPANLQYTGLPTGNNYFGVPSYPYNISVNGGPNQLMMCIGYNEHIEGWEAWQANVVSIASLDPVTYLKDYQAAFLFEKAVADGGANSDVNAAIWNLFEGAPGLTPSAQALQDLAISQTYMKGEFPNVRLYSAIPGTEVIQDSGLRRTSWRAPRSLARSRCWERECLGWQECCVANCGDKGGILRTGCPVQAAFFIHKSGRGAT